LKARSRSKHHHHNRVGSDLREKGRESIDGVDGVNLAVGIGKTLRGGGVDASDQVMGFVVAKVPLERVLR